MKKINYVLQDQLVGNNKFDATNDADQVALFV
jgi:hypothetical protein